jgi:hypothetical protein
VIGQALAGIEKLERGRPRPRAPGSRVVSRQARDLELAETLPLQGRVARMSKGRRKVGRVIPRPCLVNNFRRLLVGPVLAPASLARNGTSQATALHPNQREFGKIYSQTPPNAPFAHGNRDGH